MKDVLVKGKIESLFICPNFMNDSLCFVKPIMFLDAAHLKWKNKGTLYLATVKTGLNDIYTVAISLERANEGYDGWKRFLLHLKNACRLLSMNYLSPNHHVHGYYTFISNRDKGLVQA
jgi:hypothetical protein